MKGKKNGAFKYVSATKKVGPPAKKKPKTTKVVKTKKTEVKDPATKDKVQIEEVKPPAKMAATKAKAKEVKSNKDEAKGQIKRNKKIEVTWFTIAIQDGRSKVVCKGSQMDCLEYIAGYVKSNADANVPMFLANGFKILG